MCPHHGPSAVLEEVALVGGSSVSERPLYRGSEVARLFRRMTPRGQKDCPAGDCVKAHLHRLPWIVLTRPLLGQRPAMVFVGTAAAGATWGAAGALGGP